MFIFCPWYFSESSYQTVSNCLDECAKEVVDNEAVNASTFQGVVYSIYFVIVLAQLLIIFLTRFEILIIIQESLKMVSVIFRDCRISPNQPWICCRPVNGGKYILQQRYWWVEGISLLVKRSICNSQCRRTHWILATTLQVSYKCWFYMFRNIMAIKLQNCTCLWLQFVIYESD